MITLKHITKQYNRSFDEIALNDVSISFEQGKIHGIIGVSGAGKSTLIRLLNKLESYDQGEVQVFDYTNLKELNKESTRMLRKKIGMIFQSDHLLSRKNVIENVVFPIRLHRKVTPEDYKQAKTYIQEVGLNGYEERYPSELSGGQRQRVGIARVLMNSPEILLCDEPTSALDVITTTQILQLIKTVAIRHKITVIIVTHDMNVIKKICDTVTVMDNGFIVETGDVETILYKAREPQTRAFIQEIGLDIPRIIEHYPPHEIFLLQFDTTTVQDSLIAQIAQDLSLRISILYANITPHQGGVMIVHVPEKQDLVLDYVTKRKVVMKHVV